MVEVLRFRGSESGRRAAAVRLVAGAEAPDAPSPQPDRVAALEAALEARRGERARLVGLLTQFLGAREREIAELRRQAEAERAAASARLAELEAALETERRERARERAEHESFVDGLRAKHAEEWSKLDDERSALMARLAAAPEPPARIGWLALLAR
jgi:septal ring factor EnvC (AmiA/AmiB activator)